MPNICTDPECTITASYNFKDEKKGIYCSKHKKDGMIDHKNKRCCEDGCTKTASYNFKGKKGGLYCAHHRKDGMIDVKNKICCEGDCTILATYNKKGEKQGLYCAVHKKDGMINVVHKRCLFKDCEKFPGFNFEGKKSPLYCDKHKLDGMVNIGKKSCEEEKCNIIPSYNIEGGGAKYCTIHKKEGMIRVGHKRCIQEGCTKDRIYGFENENQLYCSSHKKTGMINLKDILCKTPMCNTIISKKKYGDYCLRCFIYLFPENSIVKNYKTKETSVSEYIIKEFSDTTIICDKKVADGCSQRRPDMFLDLGDQVIIIEVDENQHVEYNCSCENKRIMELSRDIGHRSLVFIRFNPDEYIAKDSKKITSCWGIGERGICIIKKTKRTEWNKRLECLKKQVQYWIDNRTDKTVEIIQLFYDEDVSK